MDTRQVTVIAYFHSTFLGFRVALVNSCPADTVVEITGSPNYVKIQISDKDSVIGWYSVQFNEDQLVDRLLVHRVESAEFLPTMIYALQFLEMASRFVRASKDY